MGNFIRGAGLGLVPPWDFLVDHQLLVLVILLNYQPWNNKHIPSTYLDNLGNFPGVSEQVRGTTRCVKSHLLLKETWDMSEIHLRFSKDLPEIWSWFTQDLPEIGQRFAYELPNMCSGSAQDLPKICLRFTRDLPMICPRFAWDFPEIFSRFTNGNQWLQMVTIGAKLYPIVPNCTYWYSMVPYI